MAGEAYGEGLINTTKVVGFIGCLASLVCYGFMAYYAGKNVNEPLKSAYLANYAFTMICILLVTLLSLPFTKATYDRFAIFKKSLQKGTLILVAWYLSVGTFIITDPVFQLSRARDGNNVENAIFPFMAFTAGALGLASLIGVVAGIQAPDSDGTKKASAGDGPAKAAAI